MAEKKYALISVNLYVKESWFSRKVQILQKIILKLYGSNQNEIDSLARTVEIVTKDIGVKFGIDKCGALAMKRGKEVECDGIQFENSEKIGQIGEEGYKCLDILGKWKYVKKIQKKTVEKYTLRG